MAKGVGGHFQGEGAKKTLLLTCSLSKPPAHEKPNPASRPVSELGGGVLGQAHDPELSKLG